MEAARTPAVADFLPPEIRSLPQIEMPVAGVTGYGMQNHEKQLVFFIMEEGVSFPDHSHCTQSGTIISGEMTMEINGQTELYGPGDHYHVPEGIRHRTHFSKQTFLIDLSDAPDRYKVCA
jgi:quercetin dioxygenase-like cupin family protein